MPRVRLKLNAAAKEDWLASVSTEFPDTEFRILASHTTDAGLLGIVDITTPDGDALVQRFDSATEVHSYTVVHRDEQTVLIQYVIPIPASYAALRTTGNLPRFPALMQDGWLFVEQTASQEQLAAYTAELADAGILYEIISLTQSHDSSDLLTDRQWEFIIEAVERGYYDMPRNCTLTELADVLDINNSAASQLRHRAESRIVKVFVAEAAP